jgi:hypothetical protein
VSHTTEKSVPEANANDLRLELRARADLQESPPAFQRMAFTALLFTEI